MKTIIEKIFHGFLYGIGFGVVIGAIYYYASIKFSENVSSPYNFDTDDFEIVNHRKIERNGKLLVLGRVQNNGEQDAKGVTVNVELFLKEEFVKHCDGTINGGVKAGESRNFEISCGGCKNNPIVEHDIYGVYITGY